MAKVSAEELKDTATTTVMSGMDPEDRYILSVLTKRTYLFSRDGMCRVADEQVPLVQDIVHYEAENDDSEVALEHDMDVLPHKIATDVILKGNAYPMSHQTEFSAGLAIGGYRKDIRVFGDRKCWLTNNGSVEFTEPEPFEKMPLLFERAYGGRDSVAEARHGNPSQDLQKYLPEDVDVAGSSPYLYPRNPCGRGFVMESDKESIGNILLPNLEDPLGLLSPSRLAVGSPGRWPFMPLPQAFDWYDYSWFPRIAFLGFAPEHESLSELVEEARRGYVPEDIMEEKSMLGAFSYQIASGACPGLSFPYLTGDETVMLNNIHPGHSEFTFQLPGEIPKISIEFKEKSQKLSPVLHTVLIEPDLDQLSLLWRGSLVVQRPYMPEELEQMQPDVLWTTRKRRRRRG